MTHPKRSRILMLAREALCGEWAPEGTIAQHVRSHERTEVGPDEIAFALRQLRRDGFAESTTYPGHRTKHWRRVSVGRAA
jgi:hypothetical protein